MMRRDINLLYSLTQATKKKNSSNIIVLLGVVVLLIIGLMTFMFVDAKMAVEKNQAMIDDLDDKLSQSSTLSALQKQYNELKAAYESDIAEVIAEIAPEYYALSEGKMSGTLIDILMLTDNEDDTDAGYDADDVADAVFDVTVSAITIAGETVNLSCSVTDYVDAWDFVDYLAGTPIEARPALDGLVEKNKEYFQGVEDNYSGLPTKSEGGDPIEFSLQFTIVWEALAQ